MAGSKSRLGRLAGRPCSRCARPCSRCARPLIFVAGRRDADRETLCPTCSASLRATTSETLRRALKDWIQKLEDGTDAVAQRKPREAGRRCVALKLDGYGSEAFYDERTREECHAGFGPSRMPTPARSRRSAGR